MKGRYWADRQARVFLRLRLGLGLGLRALGRLEEAAAELQQVLSLDGPDHAGARDYLLSLLLELGRDDDAEDLLERFEDGGVAWWYGRALLAYRRREKREAASRLLEAYAVSALTAEYLVGDLLGEQRARGIGPRASEISHDDEHDAEECTELLVGAWRATPGAAEWLARELKRRK